jgi:O-antigen/teichoic acid export membrane protein
MPAIAGRYAQDPDLVSRTVGRAARIVVALALVLVAGTVSVGPTLVSSVYGAEFDLAAGLVRWLALGLLVAPLSTLCTALWTGTGRLRPVLIAGGTAAAVDVGLAFALIPSLGPAGATVATLSAQAVMAVLIVGHTLRSGLQFKLRLSRLLRTGAVALAAAGAATAADALLSGWAAVAATTVSFGVVLLVGLRIVGLLDPDDREWLCRTLPERAGRLLTRLHAPGTTNSDAPR